MVSVPACFNICMRPQNNTFRGYLHIHSLILTFMRLVTFCEPFGLTAWVLSARKTTVRKKMAWGMLYDMTMPALQCLLLTVQVAKFGKVALIPYTVQQVQKIHNMVLAVYWAKALLAVAVLGFNTTKCLQVGRFCPLLVQCNTIGCL